MCWGLVVAELEGADEVGLEGGSVRGVEGGGDGGWLGWTYEAVELVEG